MGNLNRSKGKNPYSSLLDEHQPADQRGETVEDWVISRNISILNNGAPTHVNRATGGLSIPDVTMVNSTWATKAEWAVGEDPRSDHLSITIAISCQVPNPSVTHRRARCNTKEVTWKGAADALSWQPIRLNPSSCEIEPCGSIAPLFWLPKHTSGNPKSADTPNHGQHQSGRSSL